MTGSSGLRSSSRKREMIKVTVPSDVPGGVAQEYIVHASPLGMDEKSYDTSSTDTGASDSDLDGLSLNISQVDTKPEMDDDSSMYSGSTKYLQTLPPQCHTPTRGGVSSPPLDCDNPSSLSWLLNFKVSSLFESVEPHLKEDLEQGRSSSKESPAKSSSSPSDPEPPLGSEGHCCLSHLREARGHRKPPFTYTELIEQALKEKHQLTVSGIYQWISTRFPYYNQNDDRWKNSVRHNLSINPHFRKGVKASQGAGHLWNLSDMEPQEEDRDKSNWKKNRLKSYLESIQPNDLSEEFPSPHSTEPPAPPYVEVLPPQKIEDYIQSDDGSVFYIPDAGDQKLYTIQREEDQKLYTIQREEDHKVYSYDTGRNLILSSYEEAGQDKDPLSRKSILEYAAQDILMEEQQSLLYSVYEEPEHYDTLPLFPDEFTLSCYNNIPPLL